MSEQFEPLQTDVMFNEDPHLEVASAIPVLVDGILSGDALIKAFTALPDTPSENELAKLRAENQRLRAELVQMQKDDQEAKALRWDPFTSPNPPELATPCEMTLNKCLRLPYANAQRLIVKHDGKVVVGIESNYDDLPWRVVYVDGTTATARFNTLVQVEDAGEFSNIIGIASGIAIAARRATETEKERNAQRQLLKDIQPIIAYLDDAWKSSNINHVFLLIETDAAEPAIKLLPRIKQMLGVKS